MVELNGKVALVTGGVSGIGLHCVEKLLKSGVKGVTIADINEKLGASAINGFESEFGQTVIFLKVDVRDKVQFEDVFKETVQKFGNLDIVINAAGILDDSQWEKEICININGTVNCNLLALDYIQKHRSGSEGVIINMASISSLAVNGFIPVYNATKHAVLGLSRSFGLKLHYNRTKIRVISVCPGPTTTPLTNYETSYKWLGPEYQDLHSEATTHMHYQSPTHVAEGVMQIIPIAETGSVWVIENNESPYEIEIPFYQTLRKNSG